MTRIIITYHIGFGMVLKVPVIPPPTGHTLQTIYKRSKASVYLSFMQRILVIHATYTCHSCSVHTFISPIVISCTAWLSLELLNTER